MTGRLDDALPLAFHGFDFGVAEELHGEVELGCWRGEFASVGGRPGMVEGRVGDTAEVDEEFEEELAVRAPGALCSEGGLR